jgi:hypothetical protein
MASNLIGDAYLRSMLSGGQVQAVVMLRASLGNLLGFLHRCYRLLWRLPFLLLKIHAFDESCEA